MKHYRFIDYCTQAYLAVVALLILLFHGLQQPYWQALVATHVVVAVLVHVLIRVHAARPQSNLLDLFRHFYPIILYTPFYTETGLLNQMFVQGHLDGFFIGLEQRMFGFQPSIAFMDALPYLAVSELFYASYFLYYVMNVTVGLMLYCRDRRHFLHYVTLTSFIFYLCYLIYIFLPVVGSRVYTSEVLGFALQKEWDFFPLPYPEAVQAGVFFRIMKFIYANFEAHGAAFPSSHVAIAMVTLFFSWRYRLGIRHVHVAAVIMLCASTVYCRYHYLVDVLAGALLGVAGVAVGEWLRGRFEHASAV